MASTRKLILKAEYNFLAKVHWMTADDSSRKHEEKTFLPNPNAQEYVKQLFKESSLSPKDVKAIAFIYNDCEFDTWQKAYEFRRGCYEFCQKNGIFYHSSTTLAFHNFIATLRSKAVGKEGDHLTVIYAEMMGVLGKTFVRRNGQWKCMNVHMTSEFQNTQEWKHQFLKNYTPKKIIFMYHMAAFDFQQVIDLLKVKNSIILNSDYDYLSTAAIDKILHVMGEKPIPYDIALQCPNVYAVNLGRDNIISATYEDSLPFEKSGIIDVNPSKTLTFNARISISHAFDVIESIKLSTFQCKKIKVTLKIDVNAFYDFKVEPFNSKENGVEDLSEKLEKLNILKAVEKAPFSPRKVTIVFNRHECRLVFTCDNGCTHDIPDVDGLDKTPIYISFIEEKPIFGKVAKIAFRRKPECVVYDLIKLCSITTADVKNPKWGFKISKEDESMMVTLQTAGGERKSSVEFLLALMIKQALKPKLMGGDIPQKWDQVDIGFEEFIPNETLKQTFLNAGKLLKMKINFC